MADQKHTPLPWKHRKHDDWSQYYGNIEGEYGKNESGIMEIRTIAVTLKYGEPEENEANAEFIVQACNNHYEMLKLLKDVVECPNLPYAGLVKIESLINEIEGK